MLGTLALVIFLGSILVFFSDEFIKAFKKVFAIKGAKLILPLFMASCFVYAFDFWVLWVIFYLSELLHHLLATLVGLMPFQQGAKSVVLILLLTLLSVVPVRVLDVISRRKNYNGYQYPYMTSGILWILSVVLLVII